MRTLAFIGATLSLLLGGCASYHSGSPQALPYSSVSVSPSRNLSSLPQIEGPLNAAVRQAILQSGSLKLANGANADAILEITVLEVRREIAAVSSNDVGRGRKFELVANLEFSLKKPGEAGLFFIERQPFSIKRDIYSDSGLVDSEYQAVPEISRQIAERVAELLVDRW